MSFVAIKSDEPYGGVVIDDVVAGNGVCHIHHPYEKYAQMFVAAPEMLEALKHVLSMFAQMPDLKTGYIEDKVVEAIAAAENRSSASVRSDIHGLEIS